MSNLQSPRVTGAEELAEQLRNPTPEAVWQRAVEIFGSEPKAASWMTSSGEIFGGRSPQELIDSADASQLRLVLEALIRIDYGVYS